MASRIQGITVEIGGDTTKLSSALFGVNKGKTVENNFVIDRFRTCYFSRTMVKSN